MPAFKKYYAVDNYFLSDVRFLGAKMDLGHASKKKKKTNAVKLNKTTESIESIEPSSSKVHSHAISSVLIISCDSIVAHAACASWNIPKPKIKQEEKNYHFKCSK